MARDADPDARAPGVVVLLDFREPGDGERSWPAPAAGEDGTAIDVMSVRYEGPSQPRPSLAQRLWDRLRPLPETDRSMAAHWRPLAVLRRVLMSFAYKSGTSRWPKGIKRLLWLTAERMPRPKGAYHDGIERFERLMATVIEASPARSDRVTVLVDPPTDIVQDMIPFLIDKRDGRPALALLTTAEREDTETRRIVMSRLKRLGPAAPPAAEFRAGDTAGDMRGLLSKARDAACSTLPRVVLVVADVMLIEYAAGNSKVLNGQLEYFADRGYLTVLLVVNRPMPLGGRMPATIRERVMTLPIVADAETTFEGRFTDPALYDFLFFYPWMVKGRVQTTAAVAAHFSVDPWVRRLANDGCIDLALANYVWTAPVLDAVGVTCPRLCEMHDIQSILRANYRQQPLDQEEFDAEMTALARFDGIIAISEREMATLDKHIDPRKLHHNVSGAEGNVGPVEMALGEHCSPCSLTESIARAQPSDPDWKRPTFTTLDMLFVGAQNEHNCGAVLWLIDEVLPLLPFRASVVVAGAVRDRFTAEESARVLGHDHVVALGRVHDLAPLYRAARIVAVPVLEGTGTAIKTVEAISFGKAVASTGMGLRGLGEIDYPSADSAQDYARLIERLLTDDAYRAELEGRSRRLARERFGVERYRERFDRIIQTVS